MSSAHPHNLGLLCWGWPWKLGLASFGWRSASLSSQPWIFVVGVGHGSLGLASQVGALSAHPRNLGSVWCSCPWMLGLANFGLALRQPTLATLGLFVGGICHGSVVLPSWIGPRSSHRRNLESIHMYSSRAHAHGFLLVLSFGQPAFATLNFLVLLVKDAWPLAPWVMALNPAHPGNLGSLGAPFLQLHVARLCPLEPTLATLPPTTPATIFFFNLGFRAPRNLPTLPSGSGPTVELKLKKSNWNWT